MKKLFQKVKATKNVLYLLIALISFIGCGDNDNDKGSSEAERQNKIEQISSLKNELRFVESEIANLQYQLSQTPANSGILREQLQDKMRKKGEIERKIQKLQRELGLL